MALYIASNSTVLRLLVRCSNSFRLNQLKLYFFCSLCSALDAYCLLEVYDVLKQWVAESRLRIDMEPAVIVAWLQPKKEKQRYDIRDL